MIAFELLLGSALGELDDADEARVEEHVVSCDACAARFASLVRLGPAIGLLMRSGRAVMVATRSLVEQLEREHLITRRYELSPGQIVPCTVSAADIYSLSTFHADLTGVTRVDLVGWRGRFEDVPFDRERGCLYALTSSAALRPLPSVKIPFRTIAVAPDGGEHTLGDYTLDHTAFAG